MLNGKIIKMSDWQYVNIVSSNGLALLHNTLLTEPRSKPFDDDLN